MRTAPTVTIYSPATGTSGKCRNVQTNGDENSAGFQISEDKAGFNGVTSTVGHGLQAHYVAEAEL